MGMFSPILPSMTQELRKGQYTTDAALPRTAPPPVPSPKAPPLDARTTSLYSSNPEALALRSAFPTSSSLVVDGIKVAIVDYKDPREPTSKREWHAYVYTEPSVNVQPFFSRQMLIWWLRSEDGIAAVREAYSQGQSP